MKKLVLLFIGAFSLIFTISCVSKEVPVTETYYETAYRTETYTTTEYVSVNTRDETTNLTPKIEWYEMLQGVTSLSRLTSYYGYDISDIQRSNANVKNIKIVYSYTGLIPNSSPLPYGGSTSLHVHNLTGMGQITLPTNIQFGKGQFVKKGVEGEDSYIYEPTLDEQQWFDVYYYPKIGTVENPIFLLDSPDKITCFKDTSYAPQSGGLTSLGTALFGQIYKYNCSITFDADGINEFAIVTQTLKGTTISPFSTYIDIQSVQLVSQALEKQIVTRERPVPYEVQKQRTVTQTKKVPFWEVIFH